MTTFISFLRAINVGGGNVTMAELRSHFESLEFERVDGLVRRAEVAEFGPRGLC